MGVAYCPLRRIPTREILSSTLSRRHARTRARHRARAFFSFSALFPRFLPSVAFSRLSESLATGGGSAASRETLRRNRNRYGIDPESKPPIADFLRVLAPLVDRGTGRLYFTRESEKVKGLFTKFMPNCRDRYTDTLCILLFSFRWYRRVMLRHTLLAVSKVPRRYRQINFSAVSSARASLIFPLP